MAPSTSLLVQSPGASRAAFVALVLLALPGGASALEPQSHPSAGSMCTASRPSGLRERAAEPPLRDDELPWCVSADDPRCAPLHHGAEPISVASRQAATADADAPVRIVPNARAQVFTPDPGLAPHPGIAHRIERPPRAAGRPS
jgi:hypothetical protein